MRVVQRDRLDDTAAKETVMAFDQELARTLIELMYYRAYTAVHCGR